MKGNWMIYSIKRQQDKLCAKTKLRHQKKLDSLVINKRINEGIHQNPNRIITNLSDIQLNDNEIILLKLGSELGILIRPKKSEIGVIMGNIYDQIVRQNLLKKDISKQCVQTAIKSFTYSYFNLDLKNYGFDQNKVKILQNLKDTCVILKTDRRQSIVVINKHDFCSTPG